MYLRILALALLLVTFTLSANNPQVIANDDLAGRSAAPCVVGRTAPPTGFWTWPANTRVSIYLREPDFSEKDIAAVKLAVGNWDATAIETGANVHFIFVGLTRETRTGQNEMTIVRQSIFNKKQRHRALLEAHSLQQDMFIDYALILVDPSVRSSGLLTNVVAHEIGHSLGLLDCYECNSRSTAMGLLKAGNESNGIEGPTPCDRHEVKAVYLELRPRVPLLVGLKRT